ncbi:hypothetical protein KFL_003680030 [Klebsormidium nitens]|uniref:Rubisco LSMT substrate-binding domain-containing protein n=1 Tax=Klebsormidium nitens TaxID=105231 RepID=A0A1Y1IAQ7_KLENI|nr:hypothetical protein KFL_003680030 [Klebsormidium nitens]|eukprot:GAQ87653.1 hypothetical protein KFL_003680030 [Klebsormidium nitens]
MECCNLAHPSALFARCLHSRAVNGGSQCRIIHFVALPCFGATARSSSLFQLPACFQNGQSLVPPANVLSAPVSAATLVQAQLAATLKPISKVTQADQEATLLSELWQAAQVGPQPPLLQLTVSPTGVRGLAVPSGAAVQAGQLLLSVPIAAVLMVPKETKGGQQGGGEAVGSRGGLHEAVCRLAVKLLAELQRPDSVWQHYARLLPAHYESVADWTPQELSELQSKAAVGAALAADDEWQDQATRIQLAANSRLDTNPSIPTPVKGPSTLPPSFSRASPLTTSSPSESPKRESLQTDVEVDNYEPPSDGPSVSLSLVSAISSEPPPTPPLWRPPFSHATALWALRTVLTRSFSTTLEGVPVQCLVPVADMLNHAPPTLALPLRARHTARPFQANPSPVRPRSHSSPDLGFAQWRIHSPQGAPPAEACFQVFASTPLSAGQEATISYGPHTNLEFLVSYGFVPNINPADKVPLYDCLKALLDDVDAPVRLARQKEELLTTLMGGSRNLAADADGAAPRLLESLYVLHARDAAELSSLEAEWHRSASLSGAAISRPTRAAAARQVVQRCEALLGQHATTLDEDRRLSEELDAGTFDGKGRDIGRLRMALRLRMSRKQILTETRERYAALAGLTEL